MSDFCCCFFRVSELLTRHYNIEPGGIQEALSLPFQQTARYVKEHEEEVTQEEKEAIKGVLAYNKLGKYYNPKISDPVKATYKKRQRQKI